MNPSHVFSLRRPMRPTRADAISRTCRLAAAAALAFTLVRSASADKIPGEIDATFFPTATISTVFTIQSYTVGADTSVFLGGDRGYEAITLPDGSVKSGSVQSTFGNSGRIIFTAVPETYPIADLTTRKLLVGGLFGSPGGNFPAQNIARIDLSGTVDPDFGVGAGANNFVTSILPLADGSMVVGGLFTAFNGVPRLRIVKLGNNGVIDGSFSASSLIDNDVLAMAEGIQPFSSHLDGTLRTDGTILVGGTFNHVGGLPITKLARLDANGIVDTTFHPVIDERVNAIVVQPSGKIIIGGQFTNINGFPVSGIARLNRDGSLDRTFAATVFGKTAGEPNPTAVYVLKQLSSKGACKIYVGGNFSQLNGLPRRNLGFIDANGAVDTTFNPPGFTIYDKVQDIFVQPDGQVLVGETLGPKLGSVYQPTVLRLNGATSTN